MSTRSGKRIHKSLHENILKADEELSYRSEKKTRNKQLKENLEDNVTLPKSKKRENYVSFPRDEFVGDSAVNNKLELKATRSLRKNALKEQNITLPEIGILDSPKEPKKLIRLTRRKFSENATEDYPDIKNNEVAILEAVEKPKSKKNKKKKEPIENIDESAPVQTRKSKRKKKKSSLISLVVDDIPLNVVIDNINQSNMSTDSFHSAAGSPQKVNTEEAIKEEPPNNTYDLESQLTSEITNINSSINEKAKSKKKKKPVKNSTRKTSLDHNATAKNETKINISDVKDSTIDENDIDKPTLNVKDTFVKDACSDTIPRRRQAKRKCSIKDIPLSMTTDDTTIEKDTEITIDKIDNKCSVQNGQIEKRRSRIKNGSLSLTQTVETNITNDKDHTGTDLSLSDTEKHRSSVKDSNIFTLEPKESITPSENNAQTEQKLIEVNKRKSSAKDANLSFAPTLTHTACEKNTEVESTSSRKKKASIRVSYLTFTPTHTEIINTTFEKDTEVKTTSNRKRKSSTKDANLTFTPPATKIIDTNSDKDNEFESSSNRKRKCSAKDTNLIFTPTITKTIDTNSDKDKEIESSSNRKRKCSAKDANLIFTPPITKTIDTNSDKDNEFESSSNRKRKCSAKDANLTFTPPIAKTDTTSDKDIESVSSSIVNRKSSIKGSNLTFTPTNTIFDKSDNSVVCINTTFEKRNSKTSEDNDNRKSVVNINTTYESPVLNEIVEKSDQNNTFIKSKELKESFDKDTKLDSTYDKSNSKSSLVTSDSSNGTISNDISHVSITSDESSEKIMDTTPLLIESSMEDSQLIDTKKAESPAKPQTPLKREGTFTKESSDVGNLPTMTPTKRVSLPSAGCTPYLPRSSNKEKAIMNVTRSIEKGRRSSVDVVPRQTKVMFCSPVNNPGIVTQQKRKVIKSNLKGSNKSFVFDESLSRPVARKRSFTLSDADDARAKRKRLADDMQTSVDRLSRPRTSSASAKLELSTPSKKHTPSKIRPETKVNRTKLPNFAALHQRRFDKMESLDECQERKAKRAKQLLTPTGNLTSLDRSLKGPSPDQSQKEAKSQGTPTKRFQTKLPALDTIKPGYTRFGFKMNMDSNPFSVPTKNEQAKPKENKPNGLTREPTLPSLVGATSLRREAAKQIVLREKSFTEIRKAKRNENRTIIKGVRTNRRFELQMKMRNIE